MIWKVGYKSFIVILWLKTVISHFYSKLSMCTSTNSSIGLKYIFKVPFQPKKVFYPNQTKGCCEMVWKDLNFLSISYDEK